jgi:predicted P-loop ATPase
VVARDHQVHPVRDYLSGLTWDGQERVCDWLTVYLGVSDSGLHRAYGEAFMLSCVARVMEPGCKVDTVLMLLGAQGVRKSSALRTLAGDGWFADTSIDVHDKDARQALAGVWVYEWAELDALRGRESSAVKAFVSTQIDHFRPSYGRNMVDVPRQTVIVGTTNETTPLSDWTGSRRFHPVVVEAVDLDALARDRDQLWAEALHLYRSGAQWWLTPDDDAARAAASVEYTSTDPWEAAVVAWLRQNGPSTTESILAGALAKLPREQTNSDAQRISRILTPYPGVSKARRLVNGRRGSFWTIEET